MDYGEADKIVTLLTEQEGLVDALCRGARRSQRRFSGALEPFSLLSVDLTGSAGGRQALTGACVQRGYPSILADLERIAHASYGLELAHCLAAEGEVDGPLFLQVARLFEHLHGARGNVALLEATLSFVVAALTVGGFQPDVDVCAKTGQRAPHNRAVLFDARLGAVVCRAAGGARHRVSPAGRAFLRHVIASTRGVQGEPGRDPPSLAEGEARRLLAALQDCAQQQLGRPLRSAQFLTGVIAGPFVPSTLS